MGQLRVSGFHFNLKWEWNDYSHLLHAGPEDYVGGVFTVTFTGTNEASLDIVTTENSIVEGTEMFTAIIENPSSPLITPGTDDTATVTITDDDSE